MACERCKELEAKLEALEKENAELRKQIPQPVTLKVDKLEIKNR